MKRRFKHDRAIRKEVKAQPCCVCGATQNVDPCHVATFGARGIDEWWSMVPMCRSHHNEQGRIGVLEMSKRYHGYAGALKDRGWEFNSACGKTWLFNEKEKRNGS